MSVNRDIFTSQTDIFCENVPKKVCYIFLYFLDLQLCPFFPCVFSYLKQPKLNSLENAPSYGRTKYIYLFQSKIL